MTCCVMHVTYLSCRVKPVLMQAFIMSTSCNSVIIRPLLRANNLLNYTLCCLADNQKCTNTLFNHSKPQMPYIIIESVSLKISFRWVVSGLKRSLCPSAICLLSQLYWHYISQSACGVDLEHTYIAKIKCFNL